MRHATLVAIALLSLAACGRGGTAQTQSQGGDPALRAALAVVALQRSGDQQLTGDQTRQILPLLKVLRDSSPEDRQVTQAIADQIFAIFTPAQRAALDRLREQARDRLQRRRPGAGPPAPGVGGPGPGGLNPDPARRAEVRRRTLERAIRILESRTGP